jgi:hypothetical protein
MPISRCHHQGCLSNLYIFTYIRTNIRNKMYDIDIVKEVNIHNTSYAMINIKRMGTLYRYNMCVIIILYKYYLQDCLVAIYYCIVFPSVNNVFLHIVYVNKWEVLYISVSCYTYVSIYLSIYLSISINIQIYIHKCTILNNT